MYDHSLGKARPGINPNALPSRVQESPLPHPTVIAFARRCPQAARNEVTNVEITDAPQATETWLCDFLFCIVTLSGEPTALE